MTYRNLFLTILISLMSMFFSPPQTLYAGMMPNMNSEDWERELAEANRAIEEYVSALSPEEQAAFNQQVDEFSRMFENMNEEEFEQFLGEMFTDEPMMEPNPFDSLPSTPQEEIAQEIVLNAEDKKKVETALAVLDDIIQQSNLFMVIVNSASDLPNSIDHWSEKNSITNWQAGTTWTGFKTQLESFIQQLYRAEEQDLTTKKYKYLFELIADEALYNNLIQLRTELKNTVSKVEIPEFGVQKLNSETKKNIKNILGKYAESFYLLGIPTSLNELFTKYAPEEEKIKLAEEAATKRAQEASRATRSPAAKIEAGSEDMDYGYGDYYDNYYPYGGGDYGYSSPYDYGNSGSYGGGDYGSGGGSSNRGGGSGGGGNGGGSGSGGSEKEDSEDKKEEKDKDKKDKKSKKDSFTSNYELDNAVRDIKKDLEDITAAMTETEENPTKLSDLTKFVEDIKNPKEAIDETLASYILPRVIVKKIENITIALKKIDEKDLTADALNHYQKEIKKLFDEHKKTLEKLVDAINNFETAEDKKSRADEPHLHPTTPEEADKKIEVSDLSPVKQWAYFGGSEALLTGNDIELKDRIAPVSLFDIRDNITELFDKVDEFNQKTARAPRPAVKKEKNVADLLEMPNPPAFGEE
jgi:hypothetical protein